MNRSTLRSAVVLMVVVLLAGLLVTAVMAGVAQQAGDLAPATEPGAADVPDLPPSYDSGSPQRGAETLPPDENATLGIQSEQQTFSYYQVAGATLRGRSSSTEYAYDGVGCSHVTVGTGAGRILNTELPLPDGSVIKYLRVYYRDTNAANGVEGYITRYQPGTGYSDLVHTGSSDAFTGGYGFVVSAEITETVNNTPYAYTLIGWPDEASANNQICGLRVAYYAPEVIRYTYLPSLNK